MTADRRAARKNMNADRGNRSLAGVSSQVCGCRLMARSKHSNFEQICSASEG